MRDPEADAIRLEAALRPYFEEMLGARIVPSTGAPEAAARTPLEDPDDLAEEAVVDLLTFRLLMGE